MSVHYSGPADISVIIESNKRVPPVLLRSTAEYTRLFTVVRKTRSPKDRNAAKDSSRLDRTWHCYFCTFGSTTRRGQFNPVYITCTAGA